MLCQVMTNPTRRFSRQANEELSKKEEEKPAYLLLTVKKRRNYGTRRSLEMIMSYAIISLGRLIL